MSLPSQYITLELSREVIAAARWLYLVNIIVAIIIITKIVLQP
jgi:hypothetical protein